jgi:hypothetical protein
MSGCGAEAIIGAALGIRSSARERSGRIEFEDEDEEGTRLLDVFAGIVEGVGFEVFEVDPFEGGFVGGGEGHGGSAAGIEGFFPTGDAEAPAVAGFEAGEVPLGSWSGEVVAAEEGEVQELLGGFDADGVLTDVSGTGAAVAIAVEPGHGFAAAAGEWFEEDVGAHGAMMSAGL